MIEIRTPNPRKLVEEINDAIENGRINKWTLDIDKDYTHNLDQWKNQAWLRCQFSEKDSHMLRFIIIEPKAQKLNKSTFGVYHGHFAEMLLTHFDTEIQSLTISPRISQFDIVSKGSRDLKIK